MTIVTLAGVVLGDVGKVSEVVGVLTRTVDVPYLVLTDGLLRTGTVTAELHIWARRPHVNLLAFRRLHP